MVAHLFRRVTADDLPDGVVATYDAVSNLTRVNGAWWDDQPDTVRACVWRSAQAVMYRKDLLPWGDLPDYPTWVIA
jgi:hypothetical protein